MLITSIRPSTVDGIKQLAKKIKRERCTTHTEALDAASRQAGYENFVHARRQLSTPEAGAFPVYLSIHWYERLSDRPRAGNRRGGREILRVNLSRPLTEVIAKHRVADARSLVGFRVEYADHLEHLTAAVSQDDARERLLSAVRSLRFMEATGLQPVTTQKMRDRLRPLDELPGRDHTSRWFDPTTDEVLMLDEPYSQAIKDRLAQRRHWLTVRGLHVESPAWEGIYYPGECTPHLVGASAAFLERVSAAVAEVAPVTVPNPWPHETGPNGDDFVSPQRLADAKPRKPRPGPSYRDYKGATPYGGAPGIRSRWRPTKPMPLEMHRQLGTLMQRLGASGGFGVRVGNKLNWQRSQLENWALAEHAREYGPSVGDDLYYGASDVRLLKADGDRLSTLIEAKELVERGYADCKPRRNLLSVFDAAITELRNRKLG